MKFNYLNIMRITVNSTLMLFFLLATGLVLWTVDNFLNWDILPEWIERYAQLIIVVAGIITILLVTLSIVCSLASIAEFVVQKGIEQPPETKLSRHKKLVIGIVTIMIGLAFIAFHQIDNYRKQLIFAQDSEKFAKRLETNAHTLEEALAKVIPTFPKSLIQTIAEHDLSQPTEELDIELTQFLSALSLSIVGNPKVALLVCANDPYHYVKITVTEENNDYMEYEEYEEGNTGRTNKAIGYELRKQLYIQFSNGLENKLVENLFQQKLYPLTEPLAGDFIDNTEPSSWGILKFGDEVIAILLLERPINNYYVENVLRAKKKFYHKGPTKIYARL